MIVDDSRGFQGSAQFASRAVIFFNLPTVYKGLRKIASRLF